jgi:hypothetical protein
VIEGMGSNYTSRHPSRDGDGRGTAALVSLGGDDLVVELGAQVHTLALPGIEVAGGIDSATNGSSWCLLRVANRPKLLECLGTINRGLVDTSSLEDVVGGTVAGYSSLARSGRGRVVRAVGFDDIVLDEGAASPTVDSKVAVSVGLVCATVVDDPGNNM